MFQSSCILKKIQSNISDSVLLHLKKWQIRFSVSVILHRKNKRSSFFISMFFCPQKETIPCLFFSFHETRQKMNLMVRIILKMCDILYKWVYFLYEFISKLRDTFKHKHTCKILTGQNEGKSNYKKHNCIKYKFFTKYFMFCTAFFVFI